MTSIQLFIFRSKGIILKISATKGKNSVYTVFSYEYGKILTQINRSSKEKTLDIGYLIDFEVSVKEKRTIHNLRNIKIKNVFEYDKHDYKTVELFLRILALINKKIPVGVPVYGIFQTFEAILSHKSINYYELQLCYLKTIETLGLLHENHLPLETSSLMSFIEKNDIKKILSNSLDFSQYGELLSSVILSLEKTN